jgi:acyl-CoA oxidase
MLNRFAKVSPEGVYSKPPHDKLSYGGMIFIRAQMIGSLAWKLAKGTSRCRLATLRPIQAR